MKMKLAVLLGLLLSFSSYTATAGDNKKLQLGFGTYAIVIGYDEPYYEDDELSGTTLAIRGVMSDNFAIHGNLYSTDHDDFSDIENDGFDLVAYFGNRLQSQGFKIYAGGGIYNETWELYGVEFDFSGIQLSGGIGHNWENVALDLMLSIREASDYEDFIFDNGGGNVTAAGVSSSLQIAVRF